LITQATLGTGYRSLCSSLCSFLHSLVTLSLLGPNILLSTLSQTMLEFHAENHNAGSNNAAQRILCH
jgi:hypothetical protein